MKFCQTFSIKKLVFEDEILFSIQFLFTLFLKLLVLINFNQNPQELRIFSNNTIN